MTRVRILLPAMRAAFAVSCATLAACSAPPPLAAPVERDPMMVAVIEEPLMTDLDLSQSNARNLAAESGGPVDGSLPSLGFASDEAGLARSEARALAGGRLRLPTLLASPSPRLAAARALSLADRVRLLVDAGGCADRLAYGFAAGAQTGPAFPVYPRAHLIEAARYDGKDCALIAATFTSPVAPQPLMAFYHARARGAGYADAASVSGDAALLEGTKGTQRFAVLLRNVGGGVTAIDLVLRGR